MPSRSFAREPRGSSVSSSSSNVDRTSRRASLWKDDTGHFAFVVLDLVVVMVDAVEGVKTLNVGVEPTLGPDVKGVVVASDVREVTESEAEEEQGVLGSRRDGFVEVAERGRNEADVGVDE
ncbi:hypothetical protein JCM10212_000367 [Sporobolomyces blumeae]